MTILDPNQQEMIESSAWESDSYEIEHVPIEGLDESPEKEAIGPISSRELFNILGNISQMRFCCA